MKCKCGSNSCLSFYNEPTLQQVEARIVVLAVLRMIKENYTPGEYYFSRFSIVLDYLTIWMHKSSKYCTHLTYKINLTHLQGKVNVITWFSSKIK